MQHQIFHVVIIDENSLRAAILEDGLRSAGVPKITVIDDTRHLMRRLQPLDPDVIVIDLENPKRDVLEQMFLVSRTVERPVAMFVDTSDADMIEAAIDAGVSAYVVDGLKKERVKAIVDMAVSRFHAFARLQKELQETRAQLEERKLVEKAKGILMRQRGLNEDEAYQLMRRVAMNEKKKLSDIARSILIATDLLGDSK